MKRLSNYFWLFISIFLAIHGTTVILDEWQRKSIHEGETVQVTIDELNCSDGIMKFHFEQTAFEKKIDTRTCALLNKGQKIKLKHSIQYPERFLFINERSPNQFILGGLEILISLIGFLANWPRKKQIKPITFKNFPSLSDN
ncbi:MAG TPA: hypothetical protein VGQ59_08850 [Cyclobacteriaceae bacterium]|jgi:hypothetical protein|nr:hypothetical protein [Cyclobacteriaceae bacterium]